MPPLPVANAIKAKVKGHVRNGDSWMNVLHFRRQAGFGPAEVAALGTAISDAYDDLLPVMGPGTSVEEIELTDLSITPPLVVEFEIQPDKVGTSASDNLPGQLAAVVSWRTALGGRAGRGRTYLPGLAELANTLESGPTAALVTAGNLWAAQMIAAPGGLVIISYFSGYTWTAGPPYKKVPTRRGVPLVTTVTAGSVNGRWGTMRSRNNGK